MNPQPQRRHLHAGWTVAALGALLMFEGKRRPGLATVVVGVVALVVVFGLRRVAPRVPGALVLVVALRRRGLPDRPR